MKVILLEEVKTLGKAYSVVSVRDGYAVNFLFPRKLAKEANSSNLRQLEEWKKAASKKEQKIKKGLEEIKDKIAKFSCTIPMKTAEEDKLYGSVTNDTISKVLKNEGIDVDKKDIILDEPIRKLGLYTVIINLHPEVKTELKLWVVKE